MKNLNNKAFTLTELLMVVLMIGIITAMVLPRFGKVVDSFRVLEAEQTMREIRSDQETRCTLGKKYTMNPKNIKALVKTKASGSTYVTSNFTYTLTDTGVQAYSPAKNYTLQMPYYLDGRICCDQCANFTKNYLTCHELETTESFEELEKNNDPCKSS